MGSLLGLIRKVMQVVGGEGSVPGGIAQGEFVRQILKRGGIVEEGYIWHHGNPQRPLDGHLKLDGVKFKSWSDPVLLIKPEDAWLGRSHYAVGDHAGETCDYESRYGRTK
ncbi:MAG: hypothetical protein ACR2M4_03125 [Actinomycetota bacterium]